MLVEVKSGKTKCQHCGEWFDLTDAGVVLLIHGAKKPICDKCLDGILGLADQPGESDETPPAWRVNCGCGFRGESEDIKCPKCGR